MTGKKSDTFECYIEDDVMKCKIDFEKYKKLSEEFPNIRRVDFVNEE